jgi:hypothetical protein
MCVRAGPARIGVDVNDDPIGHTGNRRNKIMNNSNDPTAPGQSENNVDAQFTELVSSLPDLASIDPAVRDVDLEVVEILVPHPGGSGAPMRLLFEVPTEVALTLRAEFSPARVTAMMHAAEALASLASPPKP